MRKALNVYVLATQLIFTLLITSISGLFLGRYLDPDGPLDVILTGVGVIVGLILDVIFVIQFMIFDARNEKARKKRLKSEVAVIED